MSSHPWEVDFRAAKKAGLTKKQIRYLNEKNKAEFINNAMHESAHAAVYYYLGYNIDFMDLCPKIGKVSNGGVEFTCAQVKVPNLTKQLSRMARDGNGYALDFAKDHMTGSMGGIVFDLWNGTFGGGQDLIYDTMHGLCITNGDIEKCKSLLIGCAKRAAIILEERWLSIGALASIAAKKGKLTKSEINKILSIEPPKTPPIMGFLKHADIDFVFDIGKNVSPRWQLGMNLYQESRGDMDPGDPPYEFLIKMDETMYEEMVRLD